MDLLTVLEFFGRAICHQLPERSFVIGGVQIPICARDTGIYLGIFASLLVLYVRGKQKVNMIPGKTASLCLLLFIVPMAFDGLTSYMDVRETNNLIRITTGISFGAVLPMFLVPLLNNRKHQQAEDNVAPTFAEFIIAIAVTAGIGAVFLTGFIHGLIVSVFLITVIIVWFSLITMALFRLAGWEFSTVVRRNAAGGFSLLFLTILSLLFKIL